MTSLVTSSQTDARREGPAAAAAAGHAGAAPEAVPEWKGTTSSSSSPSKSSSTGASSASDGITGGCVDLDDYDPNVEVDDSPAPSLQAVPTDRRKVMISRMFKYFFLLQALMMVDSGLLPASLVRVTEETGMNLAEQGIGERRN